MKKFVYSGTAIATLSALVFAPVLSYAQVEVNGEADGFLNATTGLVATPTEATIDVDAGVETDTEVEIGTSESEVETDTETSTDVSLRLNAEGIAVVSPSQVNNSSDLEVFAHNTMARDERVEDIEVETTAEAKSEVEVVYKHGSRLFGLVPVTLKSKTVVVSGNGELEVDSKLSWWGFLVTDKDRIENEIITRVRDNATIMMSTEYEANASAQAEIAAAVITELDSYSSLQINNG